MPWEGRRSSNGRGALAPVSLRMDLRRPDSWQDVIPGITVLIVVIPLVVGVFFVDSLRRALIEGPTVIVLADEIRGLAPGANVWVAGKPAGRVQSIAFVGSGSSDPGLVALRIILLRQAAPMLRADATVRIGRSALLSPPVVKFRPGSPDALPYDFADTLTVTPGSDIQTFRALADSGRVAVTRLSAELARLKTEMASGRGSLPRLRRDPVLAGNLIALGDRMAILNESLAGVTGFWQLAGDSVSRERIARLAESINTISQQADARAGALEPIYQALDEISARIARLDNHLRSSAGTAGRLLYDGELQLQSERTRAQLDSLQLELAAQPFRWLRFRLF